MRNIPKAEEALRREARELREKFIALSRMRSLRDPVAGACEELQLTPPQIHTLIWLGHDGALTMGELARHVAVSEKTVTGLADRMERDGLLLRERDATDRRVVRVRLTPRGEELYRAIDAGIEAKVARLLGALEPADRKALLRILDKLVAGLKTQSEGNES